MAAVAVLLVAARGLSICVGAMYLRKHGNAVQGTGALPRCVPTQLTNEQFTKDHYKRAMLMITRGSC